MFLLSQENVADYLIQQDIIPESQRSIQIEEVGNCKNFNLLITLLNNRHLHIKQECHDGQGQTLGECENEWRFRKFLYHFAELEHLLPLITLPIHFDADSSILVFDYLDHYLELKNFYTEGNTFPPIILDAIGAALASIHRATLDREQYKVFLKDSPKGAMITEPQNFLWRLKYLSPQIFSVICSDGIEFLKLYQRHADLHHAIEQVSAAFDACCLTHTDLRLNNILLHQQWKSYAPENSLQENLIRLIDWESCRWGDPAFDLADLIANYLVLWLDSLVVSKAISLKEALSLAVTPLEYLQPSIAQLLRAYLQCFPEALERHPDFLTRVTQYAGVNLIQSLLTKIENHLPFDNRGICILQVAKSLLCTPEQAMPSVFGVSPSELTLCTAVMS
jgi:5-methylthioribose kinase